MAVFIYHLGLLPLLLLLCMPIDNRRRCEPAWWQEYVDLRQRKRVQPANELDDCVLAKHNTSEGQPLLRRHCASHGESGPASNYRGINLLLGRCRD